MSEVIPPGSRVEAARRPIGGFRALAAFCAGAALASLGFQHGFRESPVPVAWLMGVQALAIGAYIVSQVRAFVVAGHRRAIWPGLGMDLGVLLAAVIYLCLSGGASVSSALGLSVLYVGTLQGVLIGRLSVEALRINLALSPTKLHPTRTLALTFLGLIVVGTLVLALPVATAPELPRKIDYSLPMHVLNCAFTATSAVCVTGLTVYDTGVDFTLFGQGVILVLIQTGGLGIMIFGSAMGLLIGQRLSVKQSLVLQDALSHRTMWQLGSMVVFIVVFTLMAEAIGAALMYPMWRGPESAGPRWFHSVFHSVSAFCNAGFVLQSDNLIAYRRDWQVYGCIMPLIVLGGLGFPALFDLTETARSAIRRLRSRTQGVALSASPMMRHRMSLHARLVLITTTILIVAPTVVFVVLERYGSTAAFHGKAPMMAGEKGYGIWLDALFYSVTCRTAGFNTVSMDASSLSPASHLLGAILMFIGGSPASTAGGIKTVSLTVLLLEIWATMRGREEVEAFGRTIPAEVARRAGVIVALMITMVCAVTLLLCFVERAPLLDSLFETVSAAGTVGLSMGLTPELTPFGRVLIMLAMFTGRLGPVTMLAALTSRSKPVRYAYPTEPVSIG